MAGFIVDGADGRGDAGSDADEEVSVGVAELVAFEEAFLFATEVGEDGLAGDGDDGDVDRFADLVSFGFGPLRAVGLLEEGGEGFGGLAALRHGGL